MTSYLSDPGCLRFGHGALRIVAVLACFLGVHSRRESKQVVPGPGKDKTHCFMASIFDGSYGRPWPSQGRARLSRQLFALSRHGPSCRLDAANGSTAQHAPGCVSWTDLLRETRQPVFSSGFPCSPNARYEPAARIGRRVSAPGFDLHLHRKLPNRMYHGTRQTAASGVVCHAAEIVGPKGEVDFNRPIGPS